MRVRPAYPDDAERLRAAVARSRGESVLADADLPPLPASPASVREAAGEADCSFVVEENGQPVGIAIAHPDEDGREAELLALWVHPERCGRGVADRLLTRVATALTERGIARVRVTVESDIPGVAAFYHDHGFSERDSEARSEGLSVLVAEVSSLR
ncbi:GNAT family N-acetyltransferase [Halorubrum vacuolatum]|uniref:Acetyltransferase (GNAT) family protein n=1 Tax=Halorubrum vacuolatum TaxID=63740 RepID=A0A238WXK5_HALVU|nr:GNAT family N-acetyltransferase [Halorubrum vacuolatum]SNR51257.1 Acetyltransferase (GNAT) family protein [Halorubrum vacuolatum]